MRRTHYRCGLRYMTVAAADTTTETPGVGAQSCGQVLARNVRWQC